MLTEEFGVLNNTIPEDEQVTILSKLILENSLLRELNKAADTVTLTKVCPITNLETIEYIYLYKFLEKTSLGIEVKDWLIVYLDRHKPIVHFKWKSKQTMHHQQLPIANFYIDKERNEYLHTFIYNTIRVSRQIREEMNKRKEELYQSITDHNGAYIHGIPMPDPIKLYNEIERLAGDAKNKIRVIGFNLDYSTLEFIVRKSTKRVMIIDFLFKYKFELVLLKRLAPQSYYDIKHTLLDRLKELETKE